MANERERERTKSLNQALEILRERLPVPEAEKRSKIQTLRMAKEYIEFLAKFKHVSPQDLAQDHHYSQMSSSIACNEQHGQYDNESRPYDNKCDPQRQLQHRQAGSAGGVSQNRNHHQLDSLTYKFYKFRLKSHPRD